MERDFKTWEQMSKRLTSKLKIMVKAKYGLEPTELELYKLMAFSQDTGMARLYWSLDNDPSMLDVLAHAGRDAVERFAASRTGHFSPPQGTRFETPAELETQLKGVVPPENSNIGYGMYL